jgi:hypothetical protein
LGSPDGGVEIHADAGRAGSATSSRARGPGVGRAAPAAPAAPSAADFDFAVAGPADEPEIRRLMGSVAMPGDVAIRFAREPDYFLGATIMGDPFQVIIARHRPGGELAGILFRGERRVFLNGVEAPVGYIGQIRAAPRFEGRWLLARGLPFFRTLGDPAMRYLGVIASENGRARGVLAGRRPPGGLRVVPISGLTTLALVVRRARQPRESGGLVAEHATGATLPEVVTFLRREGPRRQLYPAYRLEDFTGGATMRDLDPGSIVVVRHRGAIAGVAAVWDQSAYKQDVVDGYGPSIRRIAPAWSVLSRFIGARPLPRVGEPLASAFLACLAVAGDRPPVLRLLLSTALADAAGRGLAFLTAGFADGDVLLPVARRFLHFTYRSEVFLGSWAGDPVADLDGRTPYVEIATL